MFNRRLYRNKMKGYIGKLPSYQHWDSGSYQQLKEAIGKWGKALPLLNASRYIPEYELTMNTRFCILGTETASIRVLRRLSGIFLIRVYTKEILRGRAMIPELGFIVVGEKHQVFLALRLYSYIHHCYLSLSKNPDFLRTFQKHGVANGLSGFRADFLNFIITEMETWPSYRPGNPNHKHNPRTLQRRTSGYKGYELRLFFYIINNLKFVYKNKRKHPLYRVKPIKEAEWKLISDLKDMPNYRSLNSKETVKYNRLLWPGRV